MQSSPLARFGLGSVRPSKLLDDNRRNSLSMSQSRSRASRHATSTPFANQHAFVSPAVAEWQNLCAFLLRRPACLGEASGSSMCWRSHLSLALRR